MVAHRSQKDFNNNGEGRAVSFECGSMVSIRLKVNTSTKTIEQIAFSSNGCGYMVAAAQSLVEAFENSNLKDLHGADRAQLRAVIEDLIGGFPKPRKQCSDTTIEAFRSAIADHRKRIVDEFRGDVALICTCFGISEDRIVEAIRETQAVGTDDVARACNAGNGCGSCRMLIQELIDVGCE